MGCALAYWHPPQRTWRDQFDTEHSFDELLSRLLETALGKGACGGTHVPYAVVAILRVDEQYPILSPEPRQKARQWLAKLARLLEDRWSMAGGWTRTWAGPVDKQFIFGDDLLDRITVTGHHLEWMALAPPELRVSDACLRRAAAGLRADVDALRPLQHRAFKSLLPVSHGARALSLLRGENPFRLWLKYWKAGRLTRTERGLEVRRIPFATAF